ncbi:uncharacterized protein LOC143027360 [Oratosquilla oratoria]|uniref:uncharacterized protein LOC143027360 n=1 Tax=Oratosquilla oratoria TaxID=337810 RepID=UPI003F75A14A
MTLTGNSTLVYICIIHWVCANEDSTLRPFTNNPNMRIVDVRGVLLHEKFYQRGSTIELQCLVQDVPSVPILHLAWYKGPNRLNYDTMRGGVSVKTDIRHETVTSWLRVNQAVPSDTGNYTCLLRNVVSASVIVHVLNGKHTFT